MSFEAYYNYSYVQSIDTHVYVRSRFHVQVYVDVGITVCVHIFNDVYFTSLCVLISLMTPVSVCTWRSLILIFGLQG